MSRILWYLVAAIAAIYLVLCVALLVFQRSLIYFPQPGSITAPAILTLAVDDAQVQVAVRPHDGPDALIYFGGNAEDVSRNLPTFSAAFPDRALYLMNYRGFSGSSGSPSEAAIARDALALFDQVHATHPNIAVVGRSLGTGVAVRLASQRPAARLILITPFNSLQDLAVRQYPMFPVKWLLKDTFESWKYAARISVPTRLIAAENDEVVPRDSTEQLYTQFTKGVATLQVIGGVGHNSISESPEYLKLIGDGL
ncbi:alpha/beta hydrolase [Pseudomonas sp. 681]|uniref:Alpha/beta hydrolase n=1 Tax=Pseudomonas fungipugnans TaxID=3024217 RepID=A0ABT6QIR9_9PSED|nr:alpha/beta fold hydrolase [Pseudomonas sp. 681]MDI2590776.1 alpha/beta hydrolase [Pseudomonas sp. 681]